MSKIPGIPVPRRPQPILDQPEPPKVTTQQRLRDQQRFQEAHDRLFKKPSNPVQ